MRKIEFKPREQFAVDTSRVTPLRIPTEENIFATHVCGKCGRKKQSK